MEKNRIEEIYKWAEKRRQKYNYEYQNSGSASSLRTYERYDDICEICVAAERQSKDEDEMPHEDAQEPAGSDRAVR